MKNKFLTIILTILVLLISGCTAQQEIGKTYELDLSMLSSEIYEGEINLEQIRIKETDSNGEIVYISADKSMFTVKDYELFFKAGTHEITIKYKFFEEKFKITILEKEEIKPIVDKFESNNPYYASAIGLTGEELKMSLRVIISVVTKVETYGDLRYDIPITDADPNNPNNVILLYLGTSVPSKWDGGSTWNREHVWPRSLGWFSDEGAGADLHHLRPTNPSENSRRGNKKYGSQTNSEYYEPRDEVKGDIARIIFYLMVRYEEADTRTFTTVAESKELLMQWHNSDPVDTFEANRNEKTYEIQGNRNPFIDHPECAELIWGN